MRRQKVQNPIYRALASCAVGVVGIYAGLSYLIPTYGNLGIAWTMLCAVLASGDNRHSGSGEKRQFWSTENSHLQFE